MASAIFENLCDYSFMHSSYFLTESIIKGIEEQLPTIGDYLDSRLQECNHTFADRTQPGFLDEKSKKSPAMHEYGIIKTEIWTQESNIKDELFDNDKTLMPQKLSYVDIPHLYRRTPEGYKFLKALEKFEDISLFGRKSVQILIDFQYEYWNRHQYYSIGVPMTIQLGVFWYWSNIVIKHIEKDPLDFYYQEIVCRYALLVTAVYLLLIEITSVVK